MHEEKSTENSFFFLVSIDRLHWHQLQNELSYYISLQKQILKPDSKEDIRLSFSLKLNVESLGRKSVWNWFVVKIFSVTFWTTTILVKQLFDHWTLAIFRIPFELNVWAFGALLLFLNGLVRCLFFNLENSAIESVERC